MTLGDLIKKRRRELRMSQATLADLAGVTRAAIGQWEAGITAPSRRHMPAVLDALGIEPNILAGLPPVSLRDIDSQLAARSIPLMGMDDYDGGHSGVGMPRISIAGDVPDDAIAVTVADESMQPEIANGDVIVVSRTVIPVAGDHVVARVDKGSVVREYRPRGVDSKGEPVFDLVSLSADYPTITCNSVNGYKVLGTVVAYWRMRRRPQA